MECIWDAGLLRQTEQLPAAFVDILRRGSDDEYLEAITELSLDARLTPIILVHCEDIFAHVCATLRSSGSFAQSIATLGRVVPFAPYLLPYAIRLLDVESLDSEQWQNESVVLPYLLGLFRLLKTDRRSILKFIHSDKLNALLQHPSRAVIYMAIRILQIQFDGADHWFEQMLNRHLGTDNSEAAMHGIWDDRTIDYRFLSLWEQDRFDRFRALKESASATFPSETRSRTVLEHSFHKSTACIGNILFPQHAEPSVQPSMPETVIPVATTNNNVRTMALALRTNEPMLLSGLPGAGKTMLIRHVARQLGKLHSMITLHLNEQSDAKSLVGIYSTGDSPGSFTWQPGVLTTAVREGRWVLIEDIDRAPNEVLGTLLPLIERRELYIANRKEVLYAAPGFRIIATVRTSVNQRGETSQPLAEMVGLRHWTNVEVALPSLMELAEIAQELYPSLSSFLPQFTQIYDRLQLLRQRASLVGQSRTGILRNITQRDFFKWCKRVSNLLSHKDRFVSTDLDGIFMEAMDCLVGALPEGPAKASLASVIAEGLQIDPQRRDFLLSAQDIPFQVEKQRLVVGRYEHARARQDKLSLKGQEHFAITPHTSRMLERVTAAVINKEPLLLVGETGVGKTSSVQYLAAFLGKKLVPFNLSQQSEAGDLLGGFKPVTIRSLVIPLKDDFDDLFRNTFSLSKNQQFLQLLGKQVARNNWKSVCKLWQQALKMVHAKRSPKEPQRGETPNKKRRVESDKTTDFERWDAFAARVAELDQRISTRSEAFAFKFIEGNIIKAVRNGDWILLDEINLASSDTLEAIADLLDQSQPSVLLAEAGNVERIVAHPEFRVFAAMNPATDAGKKDLPQGIRSRFTELYVESPDRDPRSLQSIVYSYLPTETNGDPAIPKDVTALYLSITSYAQNNRLVDGAGQTPHFSLRTLTRTLTYARYIAPQCNIRRALYEGFQMSFMTFLDEESAKLVEPLLIQHLSGKKQSVRTELQKALKKPADGHEYVQGWPGSKHWVRRGTAALQDQSHYILTPFIRRNLENLVRASSTRKFPVLIQGPTSSGKTSMVEYLAKRTGHTFIRINNHEHTDLQEYLGTYISGADGNLVFQEGLLVKALREGHWIVLDELNLAPTDVLEALNRLLDDNRELLIPETQEVIRPHPGFMLFATQNPAGLYGGRKTLSRAFRNRFLELHFDDIPIDELQEILHRRTQLPESRCKRIVAVYRELSLLRQENRIFEQKSFATLRDLFRWASRPSDTIDDLAVNGFMLLAERVRKDGERQELKRIIEKVMSAKGPRVVIDEARLYAVNSPEIAHYTRQIPGSGVVWTKAMRRLYVLVTRAIANNEPVLLVGETGCGKTTVCQMLSEAFGKALHTVNAHQNTETGDLIGSQRPVRNRAAFESELRSILLSLPMPDNADASSTDALLAQFDAHIGTLKQQQEIDANVIQRIQTLRMRFKALFEWVDGSLVSAMKDGSFFLLDEISLADDSVLERINSVLESQRTILLAEKGSLDASVTAVPGFQFFATMNPGGDYGKRELSPALRNRFTEIWVPALSDVDDVIQIVNAKLLATYQAYTKPMVDFAMWFQNNYNTSSTSAISIRDTLAWVEFCNISRQVDSIATIVHGAAMVYIDTLGANPAGLMMLTGRDVPTEREICLKKLGLLLKADVANMYAMPKAVQLTQTMFSIGPFAIPRLESASPTNADFTYDAPTSKSNAMRVIRALQLSKPIMLEGSPGVGKTALVTSLARVTGVPLTRINLSEQTDLLDLFGSDAPVEDAAAGSFAWRDAPFLRAMKRGEWVLLDEMNLASQSVLEGLNACLDHRGEVYVPELGQAFTRHPDFRLFAAQNPHHQGGGRKGLPSSFVNRFTVVYADAFMRGDLLLICQQAFPTLDPAMIQSVVNFINLLHIEVVEKRQFGSAGGPWEFNLRDISRWLSCQSESPGLLPAAQFRDFAELLFCQRFRHSGDREGVRRLVTQVFGSDEPPCDITSAVSTIHVQVGLAYLQRNTVTSHGLCTDLPRIWSSESLPVLQSVMLCVQANWPVIITGRSGSGKTFLLQRLSSAVGARLRVISMNSESDSMDLIGGYEQSDSHRHAVSARVELQALLCEEIKAALLLPSQDLVRNALLEVYGHVFNTDGELSSTSLARISNVRGIPDKVCHLLEQLCSNKSDVNKARFEWTDGVLVDALQNGEWLVLDNANLCSPSVLDRLNSLLEPRGTLIVSEHPNEDGSPRILVPHPNFRIFLTVDPRYGELSRAMRNRAVELFLDQSKNPISVFDPLPTESAIANLQSFRVVRGLMDNAGDQPDLQGDLLRLAHEYTARKGTSLLQSLSQQLEIGLYAGLNKFTPFNTGCEELSPADSRLLSTLYLDKLAWMADPTSFIEAQSLHPINNQALIAQHPRILQLASFQGFVFDLLQELNAIARAFAAIKSNKGIVQRVKSIESSLQSRKNMKRSAAADIPSVLNSLEAGLSLLASAAKNLQIDVKLGYMRLTPDHLCAFWWTFVHLVQSRHFDQGVLVNWVAATKESLKTLQSFEDGMWHESISYLDNAMSLVTPRSNGTQVLFCMPLWVSFRPPVPAQLHELLEFEKFLESFDQQCQTYSSSTKTNAELRLSFSKVLALLMSGETVSSDLPKNLVPAAEDAAFKEKQFGQRRPFFAHQFAELCQLLFRLSLSGTRITPLSMATIEILAGRGSSQSLSIIPASGRFSTADDLRVLGLSCPTTSNQSRPLASILQQQSISSQVPLRDFKLLQEETSFLSRLVAGDAHIISANDLEPLDAALLRLMTTFLQTIASSTEIDIYSKAAAEMLRAIESLSCTPLTTNGHGHATRMTTDSYLDRLWDVVDYLSSTGLTANDQFQKAAWAWRSFGMVALRLYIPLDFYDPAVVAYMRREFHETIRTRLSSRLAAIRAYSAATTGKEDCFRGRQIAHDIEVLGSWPDKAIISRPQPSEISELHGDFSGLLRIADAMEKDENTRSMTFSHNETLLVSLDQIRQRLTTKYRAYGDLAAPAAGFIDCIRIAEHLAADIGPSCSNRNEDETVFDILPYVGASVETWLAEDTFLDALQAVQAPRRTLLTLEVLTYRESTALNAYQTSIIHDAVDARFLAFYDRWRATLDVEQRRTMAKSSLYKFQGESLEQDEIDEADLAELFPDNESPVQVESVPQKTGDSMQVLAVQISRIYHDLFCGNFRAESFEPLLLDIVGDKSSKAFSHLKAKQLLPMTFVALYSQEAAFVARNTDDRVYNIYTDPNTPEVTKLASMVGKATGRFESLHAIWPEHATPIEVIRICDQICATSHSTPLTQFFPLLEKLHATVAEWQRVASREHSVPDLLEECTNMIISWRQAELSCWASLFKRETDNCVSLARTWWFVAFETIVVATYSLQEDARLVESHAQELLKTLEPFIVQCGMGEFEARLSILHDFKAYLATRILTKPFLMPVHEALHNFLKYHDRFTPAVATALAEGRSALEKDMRSILQVASWKDRNIQALRQSAKASHMKLVRLVRKFRALLARSVQPIYQNGVPRSVAADEPIVATSTSIHIQPAVIDERIQTNISIDAWSRRPSRYLNISATVSTIQDISSRTAHRHSATSRMSSFLQDTLGTISELRNATPKILTDKNKNIVNHLKTRKRRLLADVLKDLRLMGLQTNVSETILSKQASTHAVLARIPAIVNVPELDNSEYFLHQWLSLMSTARESVRRPSEDLTPAEVARCISFLESMLDNSIAQRTAIATQVKHRSAVQQAVSRIRAFGSSSGLQCNPALSRGTFFGALRSLIMATRTCADLIKKQGDLAQRSYEDSLAWLYGAIRELTAIEAALANLPTLPDGITSSDERKLIDKYAEISVTISKSVTDYLEQSRELEPLLSHLGDWLCDKEKFVLGQVLGSRSHDMDQWVQHLLLTVDMMLDSVQKHGEILPKADHQDKFWLVIEQQQYAQEFGALKADVVAKRLAALFEISNLPVERHNLDIVAAICREIQPIVIAFSDALEQRLSENLRLLTQANKTAYHLTSSFCNLAQKGFCTPDSSADDQDKRSGQVESGTGLGDGEGAEDISKDIEDDEDLSELAQSKPEEGADDIEDAKDAVDMADEEFEGQTGDAQPGSEEDDGGNEGDEQNDDMEEEAGSVDELGESTVDEKTWDGGHDNDQKDMQGEQGKKTAAEDDLAAADNKEQKDAGDEADVANDQEMDAAANEEEQLGSGEPEKLDQNTREEENLALPEDLNLEGEAVADDELSIDGDGEDNKSLPDQDGDDYLEDSLDQDDKTETAEAESGEAADEESEDGSNLDENERTEAADAEDAQDDVNDESDILMQNNENPAEQHMEDEKMFGESGNGAEDDDTAKQKPESSSYEQHDVEQEDEGDSGAAAEVDSGKGGTERSGNNDAGQDSKEDASESTYKKIGDVLDEWYKQQRNIETPNEERDEASNSNNADVDMGEARFEHLMDQDDEADAQALGEASMEQSTALDESRGIGAREQHEITAPPDDTEAQDTAEEEMPAKSQEVSRAAANDTISAETSSKAFVGERNTGDVDMDMDMDDNMSVDENNRIEDVDEQLHRTHLSPDREVGGISVEEAQRLWSEHESNTRSLAIVLTEHLRLILQPTQATKMRGDFRTGKRLNIKRIIPYIASSYKRDKIWMRRSVPSKRSYQIMVAIDDSESMAEGDSRHLAFDTVALVAKSMAMLEVGELSVIGFGESVTVAHDFGVPFTAEAGPDVFRRFTFSQTKTNVQQLMQKSIELFRTARLRAVGATSDLWQLQLVISDGVCENHSAIRQLVRQAHEERIMVVFVIIDATATRQTISEPQVSANQSILDLQTAEFVKDANGEMQLKMVKYLDTFPFSYYLIVRDVQELPSVLAGALRQWFAEVVDTGS